MISINNLFEELTIIKKTKTTNYNIDDFKNPDKKYIIGYRTKKFLNKSGNPTILKLALIKDPKTDKIKTKLTSLWHHKK